MMNLTIEHGNLKSIIQVPGSKSYANRILILAALKKGPFSIFNLPDASDVTWLLKALSQIGLDVHKSGSDVTIFNSFPECEHEAEIIEVGEGGTTARFLASMLLSGHRSYILNLGERLKDRPWIEFIDFVNLHGGYASLEGRHLKLKGPLRLPEQVQVDCERTTQFASGLAMVFNGQTSIIPVNMETSQSYWSMTKALIEEVKHISSYRVPMDWSSASYPLAFAAIAHPITFPNLFKDQYQADSKFLDILDSFHVLGRSEIGPVVIPVTHFRDFEYDVSDCLDLVPALSFFLAHIPGNHILSGVENLIHKESDRLHEVQALLSIFGRTASSDGKVLKIAGSKLKIGQRHDLRLVDDHRIVMTAALFMRYHSGGKLGPANAVDKSYPGFFELFV